MSNAHLLPSEQSAGFDLAAYGLRFRAEDQKALNGYDFLTDPVARQQAARANWERWNEIAEGWLRAARRAWHSNPDAVLDLECIASAARTIRDEWNERAQPGQLAPRRAA